MAEAEKETVNNTQEPQEDTNETAKNENAEKQENTEKVGKKEKKPKKSDREKDLKKQLDDKNDSLLRIAAEYDNYRKRSQKEKDGIYSDTKIKVISDFLPVMDNFERGLENSDASLEDYKKGVEMTFKQFCDVFKKLGAQAYGEVGDTFDPNIHNAVMHSDDDTLPQNSITMVLAKGYKMGEKIIRPAMVAVAN